MVQYYSIAGSKIGSHYLAMASLTAYGGLAYFLANRGSPKTTAAPPINASSPDEADFIKRFMEQAEADDKSKAKH